MGRITLNVKHSKILIMKRILFITSIIIGFVACNKEELPNLMEENSITNDKILVFNSYEDYQKKQQEIYSNNPEERKAKEKLQGFVSFGTYCDELYASINPEDYKSVEDLKAFVAENSNYLQLIPEDNGEYTLETRLFSSGDKYLINLEGMYRINETVYKVFENGKASTNVQNIEQLRNLNEENVQNLTNSSEIHYEARIIEERLLKTEIPQAYLEERPEKGNYRLLIILELKWDHGTYTNPYGTDVWSEMFLRPYIKIGFIWYYTTRTMTWDFDVEYSCYKQGGGFHSGAHHDAGSVTASSNWVGYSPIHLTTSYYATGLCYYLQDLWADTPNIDDWYWYRIGRKYD